MNFLHVIFLSIFCMTGCTTTKTINTKPTEEKDTAKLAKVSFQALPNWEQDNLKTAFDAFIISCNKLSKVSANKSFRPMGTYGDFHAPCRIAKSIKTKDEKTLRAFFEKWFDPYEVKSTEKQSADGLFTGYYEASLNGSLKRYGPYQTPLYAMPSDLLSVDLGLWYKELEGKKITARVKDGKLTRFADRAEIERDGLSSAKIVAWVDDPIDAFFLQIQGSGVVTLDNGRKMRVGYAGKNGHGYYAIGRALIERGELTKENVSLQTIRAWLKKNPSQADDLMNLNPSFVFFRKLDTNGPIGAQNVVLTPDRSIAIDRTLYDYGMPIWLSASHPTVKSNISQLMIAQDTGGAIRGVVRGDYFWGYGENAEENAGKMKSRGRYWFLLPKAISVGISAK